MKKKRTDGKFGCRKCGFVFETRDKFENHGAIPMPPGTVVMAIMSSRAHTDLYVVTEEKECRVRLKHAASGILQQAFWGKCGVFIPDEKERVKLIIQAKAERDRHDRVLKAFGVGK